MRTAFRWARNRRNFSLLKDLGRSGLPVLLKRGFSATINELIMSTEYILNEGNMNVLLCERGIRTFGTATRYTLDLSAVPLLKAKAHLPVIVDPTHALGLRNSSPKCPWLRLPPADALMIRSARLSRVGQERRKAGAHPGNLRRSCSTPSRSGWRYRAISLGLHQCIG